MLRVKFLRRYPSVAVVIKGRVLKLGPFEEGDTIFVPEENAAVWQKKGIVEVVDKPDCVCYNTS